MSTIQVQGNVPIQLPANQAYVIERDQNALKGVLWGILALELGSMTLTAGTATLMTSPLSYTPAISVPFVCGVATYLLACGTKACVENACYHFGSRQVIVIQPANVIRLQQV
jgi:hypothetical protein